MKDRTDEGLNQATEQGRRLVESARDAAERAGSYAQTSVSRLSGRAQDVAGDLVGDARAHAGNCRDAIPAFREALRLSPRIQVFMAFPRLRLKRPLRSASPGVKASRVGVSELLAAAGPTLVQALLPGLPLPFPGTSQGPGFDLFVKAYGFIAPLHGVGGTGPLGQRLDADLPGPLCVPAGRQGDRPRPA